MVRGLLCVALLASALPARAAPRREPPLLLGGTRPRVTAAAPVDPRLPTGAAIAAGTRPEMRHRSCSFARPLCVHAGPRRSGEMADALQALESAYERLVLAMGLPEPLGDWGAGGTDALDAYLADEGELTVEADGPSSYGFTRAPAFCRLPPVSGPLLERAASLCVAEAIALALDASEPPHLRRAFATSLWWTIGAPTSVDLEVVDDAQAHPESAVATRDLNWTSEGAGLFFTYLERARGAGAPGHLSAALFGAAASRAEEPGAAYVNEPDLFDVVRHSLDEDAARFAALMVDFAVTRAFLGERDDGQHLPELGWAGAFGRVRFDWAVPFSSLPRHLAIQPPLDSTGSVLVWVELDEVPIGSALAVRAEWEGPVSFQWQLVKIAPTGEELGRVDVPFQQRGREAETRMTALEGAAAVLIVGVNLEGIEIAHPFDPDVAPFEPHGASLYLARL